MAPVSDTINATAKSRARLTNVTILVNGNEAATSEAGQGTLEWAVTELAIQILKAASGDKGSADEIDGAWYASSPCAHLAERANMLISQIPATQNILRLTHRAFARMLPFWLRQFDDANLPVQIIFPIGGSDDVQAPIGAAAAWLRTLIDAERMSQGRSRLILSPQDAGLTPGIVQTRYEESPIDKWARDKTPLALSYLRRSIELEEPACLQNLAQIDLEFRQFTLSCKQDDDSALKKQDRSALGLRLDILELRLQQDSASLSRLAETVNSLQTGLSAQFSTVTNAHKGHVKALEARIASLNDAMKIARREASVAHDAQIAAEKKLVDNIAAPDPAVNDALSAATEPTTAIEAPPSTHDQVHASDQTAVDIDHMTAETEWDPDTIAIRNAALFDADFYLAHNPDVRDAEIDPASHYLLFGGLEGRDPSPAFWSAAYLASYSDVADAGLNPLLHYIHFGEKEGRDPRPLPEGEAAIVTLIRDSVLFDAEAYANQVGLDPIDDPARHYYDNQRSGGLNPGPGFWSAAYLESYPDVVAAGLNPFAHYLSFGAAENRDPRPLPSEEAAIVEKIANHPLFDASWYQEHMGTHEHISPARHFYDNRTNPRLDPGPYFKTSWYLRTNDDVVKSGIPAFLHFMEYGDKERRLPAPRRPDFTSFLSTSPSNWSAIRLWEESSLSSADQGGPASGAPVMLSSCQETSVLSDFLTLSGQAGFDGIPASSATSIAIDVNFPEITDAWFANQATIFLRFDNSRHDGLGIASRVTAYQAVDNSPQACGTFMLPAQGPALLKVRLFNPFFPILLLLDDGNNAPVRARLIPFPSLYRGGMHAGEVAAAIADGSAQSVSEFSNQLFESIAKAGDGAFAISQILIDDRHTLQTEPAHNIWFRQWVQTVMCIPLIDAKSMTTILPPLHQEGNHMTGRDGAGYTLHLPGDHLPTISGLCWKTPHDRTGARAADFIVVNRRLGSVYAAVKLPVGQAMGSAGTSPYAPLGEAWPHLEGLPHAHPTGPDHGLNFYLSIKFADAARDDASLLLRSAPDISESILPQASATDRDILVVLNHVADSDDLKNCLFSLSLQTKMSKMSVSIISDKRQIPSDCIDLAQTLFGSRIAFFTGDDGTSAMRDNQSGGSILLMDDTIILHDRRTVETLASLSEQPNTASASCMLVSVSDNGKDIWVASSGNFYDQRKMMIDSCDMFDAFPYNIYPVSCGNRELMMISSHASFIFHDYIKNSEENDFHSYFVNKSGDAGLANWSTSMISATLNTRSNYVKHKSINIDAVSIDTLPQIMALTK